MRKTSFLSRKPAGGERKWFSKELLVSHHPTTFQTMKIGSIPKMNPNRCKIRVRGPKHVARGPENRQLGTRSGVRPRRWSLGPQCPSKERKQGVCQKPEQTELVKRSRTEAHGRQLRKSKTGLQTGKMAYDHKT